MVALERASHRAVLMQRLVKLLLGALLAVSVLGCFPGGRHGGGALATGLVAGAAIGVIAASSNRPSYDHYHHHTTTTVYVQSAPPPAPPPPPRPAPEPEPENPAFDATAVRTALGEVDVTPCNGPPGYGHARVTMNPDGRISRVLVEDPADLPAPVAQCIGKRLGQVKVAPFKGSLVVVGTSFRMN